MKIYHFPWVAIDALDYLDELPVDVFTGPHVANDHTFYCSATITVAEGCNVDALLEHNSHLEMTRY